MTADATACPGCGVVLPAVDGPTHRYLESSPACWAAYGEVLAREYEDPAVMVVHRLTVDAYAVQHPGRPSPQSAQSVNVHLLSLHLVLEAGFSPADATRSIGGFVRGREHAWLPPPPSRGALTVRDVQRARGAAAHADAVRAWAASSWEAWAPHHDAIRRWAADVLA